MKKEQVQYFVIHHWGHPKATMQSIRNKHIDEYGWSDVGYHVVIGNGNGIPDGEILEGRPFHRGACQCRGFNSKSISILVVGNFDLYYPSKNQWTTLKKLLLKLMGDFPQVPVDNIIGHRESYGLQGRPPERSCPGWKFDMDKLRRELYDGDSELFSDGVRRRFDISVNFDGISIPDVCPEVVNNRILIPVGDIEKIFSHVKVEFQPQMRQVEIILKSGEES